jgi:hypothetical protein
MITTTHQPRTPTIRWTVGNRVLGPQKNACIFENQLYSLPPFDWLLRLVEPSKRPFSKDIVGLSAAEFL